MLLFTPVKGKIAFLENWPENGMSEEEARKVPGATGIALIHKYSNTVAMDFDDWSWCLTKFNELGINIEKEIQGHFEIVSPKQNTRKIIFERPKNLLLGYLKLPPQSTHPALELRVGSRYEVWSGSDYPTGDKYTHSGSKTILPLPEVLKYFWIQCLSYKTKETKTGSGEVPLVTENKLSIIHLFNITYPLEQILEQCGYTKRGNKWKSPHSQSGSYGLTCQPSYLNPWDLCYSHHASDGALSNRPIDAFEIAAQFKNPSLPITKAKAVFTAMQAKILRAVDAETGEIMSISAHDFNNPSNLLDTIDEITSKEGKPPEFTEDILNSLPDPIPLLLKNFVECVYDPVPSMYSPAFMVIHEVLLKGKIRTIRNRSVNCNYANGSISGGGKDANSTEACMRYGMEFDRARKTNTGIHLQVSKNLITPLTTLFTSGNNLLKAMHNTTMVSGEAPYGGVFMNAEATAFYKNISDNNNQFMGKAITDVEISCFNGLLVPGSRVTSDSKNHLDDIINPNFSFYRLTQMEPFKEAFGVDSVVSGYYGRLFETYDNRENIKPMSSSSTNEQEFNFNAEGFKFLVFMAEKIAFLKDNIQVKANLPGGVIAEWEENVLIDKMHPKIDNELFPGIRRIPQIAEKWVATITAYNYFWLLFKGKSVRHLILKKNADQVVTLDGSQFESSVLPMIEYLSRVKWYSLHTHITRNSNVAMDLALEKVWRSCVNTDYKKSKLFGPWLRDGKIPYVMFADKVKKSKEFRDISNESIDRMIRTWLRNTGLNVSGSALKGAKTAKKKTCIMES